ncbi:hypothetical protein Calab_2328 [Caldithrix abyssi DSM 13497]|uniref:AttH domain-containing protein n=1 Tax=Caldithrix abyssi DSM 13497 TaxID=880073 RepID=H1XXF3_CALAY|nr:hypothetical protein [Caldithrix abyssi]APF17871.1 hypothetical protein Cabys_1122 [Caldithrix abyssi DSM 13497]EHO41938.1 hypothetical protein Calab_2328 [Caldithrix abyssi DSM 13497]
MPERFFEWYYIDIHQDDGYDLVFSLHTHPFMSQFNISILDAFVYFGKRQIFHKFLILPRDEMLKQGEGTVAFRNRKIRLDMEKRRAVFKVESEKFHLDLTLQNEMEADLPLSMDLYEKNAEKSFEWKVFMPLARASGRFSYIDPQTNRQKMLTLTGRAYFDSNRGTINLKKEMDHWHWAKLYFKDALWIVGKVVDKRGRAVNIVVNCSPEQMSVDRQAKIAFQKNELHIDCVFGNKHLHFKKEFILDDQRFLIATWPEMFSLPGKIIEAVAGVAVQKQSLRWLARILTNGRYFRKRWLAEAQNGEQVLIFGEEMLLK